MTREFDRGELQDRLPEYVHGTLPADERVQVEAQLAADPELARELDVVSAARTALMRRGVAVDVSRVVGALPRPRRSGGFTRAARLRIAAAIATIAVGGASLAVVQRSVNGDMADSLIVRGETAAVTAETGLSVSFGYDLSSLDESDLDALLAELEQAAGLPPAEPRSTAAGHVAQEGVE